MLDVNAEGRGLSSPRMNNQRGQSYKGLARQLLDPIMLTSNKLGLIQALSSKFNRLESRLRLKRFREVRN